MTFTLGLGFNTLSSLTQAGGGAVSAISNGDFSAGQAPWQLIQGDETSDFSGGQAIITAPSDFGGIFQNPSPSPIPVGTTVNFSMNLISVSGGNVELIGKSAGDGISGGTSSMSGQVSTPGVYSGSITLGSPIRSLALRVRGAGTSFTVDDIVLSIA